MYRQTQQVFLLALVYFTLSLATASAQSTYFPATGIFNGAYNQLNVAECDNGNNSTVNLTLVMRDSAGQSLDVYSFAIKKFGSAHIILNDRANIVNKSGTYLLTLKSGQETRGDKLNCRTAFYRIAPSGPKQYEFAYVIPVANQRVGALSGIYNSIDPGLLGNTTLNWLTISNLDSAKSFSAVLKVRNSSGGALPDISVSNIPPRGQRTVALGHPLGQVSGIYTISPSSNSTSVPYHAVLVRFNPATGGGFTYALPLLGLPPTCTGEPLQSSTMNNGATDNYAEIANLRSVEAKPVIKIYNRSGTLLQSKQLTIPPYRQQHIYLSPIIDPLRKGNVGSFKVECVDPTDRLIIQSTFYGRTPGSTRVNWSYSSQAKGVAPANSNSEIIAPVNTFTGINNWLKYSHVSGNTAKINFKLFDFTGGLRAQGVNTLVKGGTYDQDIHSLMGRNSIGSITLSSTTQGILYNAEMLRVLTRPDNGDIASITPISGIIRQKGLNGGFVGNPQSLAKYRNKLTFEEARRLLTVTSFGGNKQAIDKVIADGLNKAVDDMLNCSSIPSAVTTEANDWLDGDLESNGSSQGETTSTGVRRSWLTYLYKSPCPLKEKMALFLHDRVASSCRVLSGGAMMQKCKEHLDLIRQSALGKYGDFMSDMAIDFLMLKWLNGEKNVYIPNSSIQPNQNWFRELNELFMLGERTAAGAGLRYPLYTEAGDIIQGSLAATGYTTNRVSDEFGETYSVIYNTTRHYNGNITLWKDTPYQVTGSYRADTLPNAFISRRGLDVGRYLGQALFTTFCHDHADSNLANQLADLLVANNFNLKPVVSRILKSEACFSRDVYKSRAKDPITYTIGFLKSTGIPMRINELDDEILKMGTILLNPVDVFGFPAFGFRNKDHIQTEYNNAFSAEYYNFIIEAVTREDDDFPGQFNWCNLNPSPTALASEVVDHVTALVGISPSANERTQYIRYLDNRYVLQNGSYTQVASAYNGNNFHHCRERLAGLLQISAFVPSGLSY